MALQPEAKWRVSHEGGAIVVIEHDGTRMEADIDEIQRVQIATNDTGPWGADFWWVFEDAGEIILAAFPQGATGEETVAEWVRSLPGFDLDAFGRAVRSTQNADFTVWLRP